MVNTFVGSRFQKRSRSTFGSARMSSDLDLVPGTSKQGQPGPSTETSKPKRLKIEDHTSSDEEDEDTDGPHLTPAAARKVEIIKYKGIIILQDWRSLFRGITGTKFFRRDPRGLQRRQPAVSGCKVLLWARQSQQHDGTSSPQQIPIWDHSEGPCHPARDAKDQKRIIATPQHSVDLPAWKVGDDAFGDVAFPGQSDNLEEKISLDKEIPVNIKVTAFIE